MSGDASSQIDLLKDSVHKVKLKDAITRSEVYRAERDKAVLLQTKLEIQKDIAKLERELGQEDRQLKRQEDDLAYLRSKDLLNNSNLEEEIEALNDRHKSWLTEMLNIHNEERSLLAQNSINLKRLENAFYNKAELMRNVHDIINGYESLLTLKDNTIRIETAILYQDLEFSKKDYQLTAGDLEKLRTNANKSRREIYEMDRLCKQYEVKVSKDGQFKSVQAEALAAADLIMSRLKQKLVRSSSTPCKLLH